MASLMGGTATHDPDFERAALQARQLARQAWAARLREGYAEGPDGVLVPPGWRMVRDGGGEG